MEDFWFVAFAMGLSQTMFFDGWDPNFDLIGELPYEVATGILRLLDGKSLLAAALVCRKWRDLIKSDCVLRERVRRVFVAERMANLYWRTRSITATATASEVEEEGARGRSAISEERRAFGIGERGGKKRKFANEVSARGGASGARAWKSKRAKKSDGGSWTTRTAVRLR